MWYYDFSCDKNVDIKFNSQDAWIMSGITFISYVQRQNIWKANNLKVIESNTNVDVAFGLYNACWNNLHQIHWKQAHKMA